MSFTPRPVEDHDTDLVLSASDPLDEATALSPPVPRDIAAGTTPPPLFARGSEPAIGRRATTQNTIPRATRDEDVHLADTEPHAVLPALPRRLLGGYRIAGVLASGQMGVVYRGEHPSGKKPPVAIKAVHGQLQSNPQIAARFFAESIALARVTHPNVVRFHDFGYDAQGSAYLVMELLDGETLADRLARERRLDLPLAIDISMQVAHALAAAHAQGVIHRDIKPENVFLCRSGTVKLLDFGVAKIEGQGPMQTLQGDLLGTAAYMAPEQGRSASESDARSDLYSMGCILFEMVCGVVPFPGSLVETLVAHQTAQRPPARALNPHVTVELDSIIDRLLSRDPAARPQTAIDVVRTLARLDTTVQRSPARPARSGTANVQRARQRVRGARSPRAIALVGLCGAVLLLLLAWFAVH